MDHQSPTYRGFSAKSDPVDQPGHASSSGIAPAGVQTPDIRNNSLTTGPATPTPTHNEITPNPFATPLASRRASSLGSDSAYRPMYSSRYFHSRRINKDELDQPWKLIKDPNEKWVTIIPLLGLFIGLATSGYLVWDGVNSVVKHKYCPVYQDDFTNGFNTNIWTKEAEVGGFG